MKKILSLALITLIVFSMLSILQIDQVMAATDEYFIYSRFNPSGIGDVTGVGGYVEYYGVPEWGDEVQYVYFLSGKTGYKMKVWVSDGDGDGKIEPRQHPSHYITEFQGPIEPRHFQIVSQKYLGGYTGGSSYHSEEFYVESGGVYLGAYPYGIHKWDHDWNFLGKIANSPPSRTESMAYNSAGNIWYAGGRSRTIYQLSDTDSDGSFLDESWIAIFTYPNYGGSHHDGMEYVGGYIWVSDMTSDVIGKWEYDASSSSWKELNRFTYSEPASVEGMGFGPNDHFWCGSGWGSGSYLYELGNEITKGYPIADAGDDVDNHPPTIPLKFDASESHHTDPTKDIVLYEWDFESDGTWDYSFGRFVFPTGKAPTTHRHYGYDEAVTYYDYAGWMARSDMGHYTYPNSYHIGQDIPGGKGDPVYAIADGEIVKISTSDWGSDAPSGSTNYAYLVQHTLDSGQKFIGLYGHVKPTMDLSVGTHLSSGQQFAKLEEIWYQRADYSWYQSPVHLHFGIRDGTNTEGPLGIMNQADWPNTNGFVDPIKWMATKSPLTLAQLQTMHAYLAYYNPDGSIDWSKTAKDYIATLRVTDNSDPALRDTDTRTVHITAPPWKPVADPDGPYEGYEKLPIQLDGSNSYDPESQMFSTNHPWYETIATYEWDLDNDGEFDDATGSLPTHIWDNEGIYTIRLKVTDSQPSGPGGTIGPLDFDTTYTTVIVKSGVVLNVALIPVDTSDDTIQNDVSYFTDLGEKLRKYYAEVSYGFLHLEVQVYTESDGSTFSVPQSTAWYTQTKDNEKQFIEDSIEASDDIVNFKLYDYDQEEGKGIPVFIPRNPLHSGPRMFENNIFRGQWSTDDGVKVDAIIVQETRFVGNSKIIRGLAHEVGHWVGKVLVTTSSWPGTKKDEWWALPDLYQMDDPGGLPPVNQRWCLMGLKLPSDSIEAVHLSSYCKEWLGWLQYSGVTKGSSYSISSLTTLSQGDDIYRYTYRKPWWEGAPHYHILETRTNAQEYSDWDRETEYEKVLAFYEVDERWFKMDTINLVSTLTSAPDEFSDPDVGITYKMVSLEKAGAQVSVEDYKAKKLQGASLTTMANVLTAIQPILPHTSETTTFQLPDIDLHAYLEDGSHVGVNYETGEYEVEIPEALSSGDLDNGREWIFVPEDEEVYFCISAKDNAEFMDAFPEAGILTDGMETYTISVVYYDPNENRCESEPTVQEIMPGEEITHRFAIIQNPDGTYTPVIDDTPPMLVVEVPGENVALQDGVNLKAHAWDENGVNSVTFSIREPNGETGVIIAPEFEYMPASLSIDNRWVLPFETTQLPDGYYLAYVQATDIAGNIANETVPFSIRNWACFELLPATETNKAGRTMPTKFSLRIAEAVDPTQPFVYNEELTILIYEQEIPATILQESTYGESSRDYRIDLIAEHYITNFRTMKTPTTYIVEIYRKDMLIDSFTFETNK